MANEWWFPEMWSPDDADAEAFEQLYRLESLGNDVEAKLDVLRARREAEDVAFEALTGVGRQLAPPEPTVVMFPTEQERKEAYERAPIITIDARTHEIVGYKPRQRIS